jgi:putative PIN family toxin of toxin-antitoxin system
VDRPKLQVVIDTNVWLSGLVFGGNPEQIIRLFIEGAIIVVTSEELLTELRRKVTQKFPLFAPYLSALEVSIREKAIVVQLGTEPVNASRDPDDNQVIETALIGVAKYVVSGDTDLLVLKEYESVQIVKPATLLELLSSSSTGYNS